MLYAFRNPPPQFLKAEIAPFAEWLVWHLLISPRLELYQFKVEPLGDNAYHIEFAVENTGWLPSYVTKKALEKKLVRGVVCEITLPKGATLASGKPRQELCQLEGRAYKPVAPDGYDETDDRAKVEWVVHAPRGGRATVVARHERAGSVSKEIDFGDLSLGEE
jgi:hypothetical protein